MLAAGVKQVTKGAIIRFHAALICRKHIAHEDDGGMSDPVIEIPALNFFSQFQVLFGHFEKQLDVPAFAVYTHDVLIGQLSVC